MTADNETGDGAGGPTRFALPVHADIRVAAELQARCRAALEATGDVQIDCDAVERVDAAALQCIGALGHGLRQSTRQLELVNRSAAFDRAVDLLGFAPLLTGGTGADQ